MLEFVPCNSCGELVKWDEVHRFKYPDNRIEKLCSNCCPRCNKT